MTIMRNIIIACTIFAGACDAMPTDENEDPIEFGESEESGDLPIANPEPPAVLNIDDDVLCSDVPDRTAYAAHFDGLPLKCRILETGLLWATINMPGYEAGLQALAESKREAWGIAPGVEILAAYTFSDLTPDP